LYLLSIFLLIYVFCFLLDVSKLIQDNRYAMLSGAA
jgi:hypothetical protein